MRMRSLKIATAAGQGRTRAGLTLIEVIVALSILGGVLLGLGLFSVRLSQSTSTAKIRVEAAQLAAEQLEMAKSQQRYSAVDSFFIASEATIALHPGFTRQTWVQRIGGAVTDTIDYKIVTVQVGHNQLSTSVRKTTVIAPF
jgi:prepilin-type N-terminal cleavage/methylation domain-containing protein